MTTRFVMIAFVMLCLSAATKTTDVSGIWDVTITTAEGKMTGEASLKQTGDNVTGQIGPSGDATIPIEGVLAAHKLTLKTHPQPGRTSAFDSCELTVGDETMAGTIQGGDAGKGTIEFVRRKSREAYLRRPVRPTPEPRLSGARPRTVPGIAFCSRGAAVAKTPLALRPLD